MGFEHEPFARLLAWLNSDRELAVVKYEGIRRSLIKVFTARGCSNADELANETVNRVVKRIETLEENYVGDPALYFYGVARHVYCEYLRRHP
jgi:DNA-directed RNA polymerase specialized sigma24 family protein